MHNSKSFKGSFKGRGRCPALLDYYGFPKGRGRYVLVPFGPIVQLRFTPSEIHKYREVEQGSMFQKIFYFCPCIILLNFIRGLLQIYDLISKSRVSDAIIKSKILIVSGQQNDAFVLKIFARSRALDFQEILFVCLRVYGPVVQWQNSAFASRRREFDSPQVHNTKNQPVG